MVEVRLFAPVRPTESPERVARALLNLFPDATVEIGEGRVSGTARSLEALDRLISEHRIPDTARAVMLRGRDASGMRTTFLMGKQAASVGRPHFAPPASPLGDVEVTIEAGTPLALEEAIYRIAHDTTVPIEWARVPPQLRPSEIAPPAPARETNGY